ncbi:hypothetical protein RJK40_004716 [Salmonella enterica]|nr:hypothetical protein [Salmonella enterica subsp. enterica]ELC5005099.1 hypothetical protein [Salmonella enterica]
MKNKNVSFRAEIIEKGNADFIFLYRRASGVTELIHSQPMPECYGELDDWLSQLPPKARYAVYYAVQENIRSLGITLRFAEIIYRNSKVKQS